MQVLSLKKYAPGIDMVKAELIKSELESALMSKEVVEIDFNGILAIQTKAARYIFANVKQTLGEAEYSRLVVKKNLSSQVHAILMLVGV